MNEVKYTIAREQAVCISPGDADKLIARHDGLAALLYLYLLRRGGSFVLDECAKALGESALRIRAAAEALESMGLLEISSIPEPAQELPEISTEDIKLKTMDSPEFADILDETEKILGRVFSPAEVRVLFGIYDYLGLPAEVILMLVSHCLQRTQRKYGPGKLPTMRTLEKEAYEWANREILTLEMAEEHLKYLQRMEDEGERIKLAIGIEGRALSSTERKYIDSWVTLGFTAEALAIAYDRTVVKTGKLQWKYMNSIVQSWHAKNLHSPQEILDGDGMTQGRSVTLPQGGTPARSELDRMEKLMNKMKNN